MTDKITEDSQQECNGGALAALVAAGVGCAFMGLSYTAATASASLARHLAWYAPAGALSGMSIATIAIWLAVWAVLHFRFAKRNVSVRNAVLLAGSLLIFGLIFTFPPVARLF